MENTFEYNAIIVDTSVFMANGLRLNRGSLQKLRQFSKSPVDFLMPDVIRGELEQHLEEKINSAMQSLKKGIKDANDCLSCDDEKLESAKELLLNEEEAKKLAQKKVGEFIKSTGALLIKCGDYLSLSTLLDTYFSSKPPFANKAHKKHEFPDAMVLLAIEAWAEEEDKLVLAVSLDNDWCAYGEHSERITIQSDLVEALAAFKKANAPYAFLANLEAALKNNDAGFFLAEIKEQLKIELEDFCPELEVSSDFYVEQEDGSATITGFHLNSSNLKIIEVDADGDYVVIGVEAEIFFDFEALFCFSAYDSIDKDYVPMGSAFTSGDDSFISQLLITVSGGFNSSGNFDDSIEKLSIDQVEVASLPKPTDLGHLKPELDTE